MTSKYKGSSPIYFEYFPPSECIIEFSLHFYTVFDLEGQRTGLEL